MEKNIIFEPLKFRNLTIKNRIVRSNTYSSFDNPDGSGNQARINWEEKFARGGVGAILSSVAPVHSQGRIVPNCATIDSDESIPFWRNITEKIRAYDCKYIAQLSYGGTHLGVFCQTTTPNEIQEIVKCFASAARRAREAGIDGVEVDATASGTGRLLQDLAEGETAPPVNLIGQFLRSDVNRREDEYGGCLENRVRFLLDIIKAIRQEVGEDFHLQVKFSALDNIETSIQICLWMEAAGADALHVGSKVPYAQNPSGNFPWDIEGAHLENARQFKQSVNIPVLCTGGFQTATYIRKVIKEGYCDAVTIARALIANNDLAKIFAQGKDSPDKPCTYCDKCRINLQENPLGCYDVSRYDGDYGQMIREIMSVYR